MVVFFYGWKIRRLDGWMLDGLKVGLFDAEWFLGWMVGWLVGCMVGLLVARGLDGCLFG
jgi:hypothetical protein